MEFASNIKLFTRSKSPIVIYTMDAGGKRPIHGAYYSNSLSEGWFPITWKAGGAYTDHEHPLDIDWEGTEIVGM